MSATLGALLPILTILFQSTSPKYKSRSGSIPDYSRARDISKRRESSVGLETFSNGSQVREEVEARLRQWKREPTTESISQDTFPRTKPRPSQLPVSLALRKVEWVF